MKKLADLDSVAHDAAIALLAVHAAISMSDAVSMALTGARSKSEDHRAAIASLKRICTDHGVADANGVKHLQWLLGEKSNISYVDRAFTKAPLALDHAQRFQAWAYYHFKEVLRVQESTY